MDYRKRLSQLRAGLAAKEIDAIFISEPANRCYLSGFNGSSGYLLITPDAAVLATDFRYIEQGRMQAPDYEIFRITGDTGEWFPRLVSGLGDGRLGFESAYITYDQYRQLTKAVGKAGSGLRLVPVSGLAESLRVVKEPEEVKLITEAVALTDRVFEYAGSLARLGVTEKELAWAIEKFLRENGSEPVPFELIVASGPNSALPHAKPGDRRIESGEPVVIDIGAKIGGYSSDMTRTFCLGKADEKFARIYDIVLGAQLATIAMLKEGMTGGEADKIGRTVIAEAGYAECFGHGLGHGVGLATHEAPRLGPDSMDKLVSGMVFTIEPGIYLPGWGGVRIEDVVMLEDGKPRVISEAKKVRR